MRAEEEVARIETTARFPYRSDLQSYSLMVAARVNKWRKVDVWEFGVAAGSSIRHIAAHKGLVRNVVGFDTFTGLPEKWERLPAGTFSQKELPKVPENVTLVEGLFADTLPKAHMEYPQPQVLHIDCDLYAGTRDVLTSFGKLPQGMVVIFDEMYNYIGYARHEMKAWLEHAEKHKIKYKYIGHVSRMSGIENRGPFQAALIVE